MSILDLRRTIVAPVPLWHLFGRSTSTTVPGIVQRKSFRMKNDLSTMCLFVLLIVGSAVVSTTALTPPTCWSFNTPPISWTNTKTYLWKFNANGQYPDSSSIPSFTPYNSSLGYAFLQDQATPPQDASIVSPTITLVTGDIVYATIYRNILDGRANDSSRPIVRFYNGYGFVDMAYSVYYNELTTVASLPCGSTAPGSTICCYGGGASCTGYLQIDGQVLIRDELLVIDSIGINDYCNGSSPPPPPPPPPPSTCVWDFDTNLDGWSADYIATGWVWSKTLYPPAVPSDGTDFLYIIDTSASVYYPYPSSGFTLTGVTSSTTFSFDYYLSISVYGVNKLDVYFVESGTPVFLKSYNTNTTGWLPSGPLPCPGCCTGGGSCSGTIYFETTNAVTTKFTAAIDDVTITNASC